MPTSGSITCANAGAWAWPGKPYIIALCYRPASWFADIAVEQAQGQLRDGLPLRADIHVVGYLARKERNAHDLSA
jgi:hypothetical protein